MQSPLQSYSDAIGSVESGGDYNALGPKTDKGDQAYGKYQVMGSNIPAWTKIATGSSMTPQEFLKNPDAQDQVFNHYFGGALNQYGNPQDAASVWFSGRPMAKAGNASDGYNTTPQYVDKFNKALSRNQPQENGVGLNAMLMAFADPSGQNAAPQPTAPAAAPAAAPSNGGWMNAAGGMGDAIQGAGANLMAIGNPAGAAAMSSQLSDKINNRLKLQSLMKPTWGVIGKDPLTGVEQYGWINPNTQTVTGASPSGGSGGGASMGDISNKINSAKVQGATTADLLKQVPAEVRPDVDALINGTSLPTNYTRQGPLRNALITLSHTIADGQDGRPAFDENVLPARVKFNTDMLDPKQGNVGGQTQAVRTMFDHLAETVAPAMVGMNNKEAPGGSVDLGRLENGVANRFGDNPSKVANLNAGVDVLTGEKAKYYYGQSGGGVEERQQTRQRFNQNDPPSVQAGTLEAERDLAIAKANEMQKQADQATQGKYTIMGPAQQAQIDKLNKQITTLRARAAGTTDPSQTSGTPQSQAAPAAPQGTTQTKQIGNTTYHNVGGHWFPEQ